MLARAIVALLLLACQCQARVDVMQSVENPHMQHTATPFQKGGNSREGSCSSDCVASCPQQGALDASMILTDPVMTQPDTLMMIQRKKYMGLEVPIYHFKQPDRLNPSQLPFRLIRTRHVDETGLVVIAVDFASSHDSWFPHYKWDLLVCNACDKMVHLGWRFTPKVPGTGQTFYALIVDYSEDQRRSAETTSERGVLEELTVGVRAPAWLIALATTTLHSQFQK